MVIGDETNLSYLHIDGIARERAVRILITCIRHQLRIPNSEIMLGIRSLWKYCNCWPMGKICEFFALMSVCTCEWLWKIITSNFPYLCCISYDYRVLRTFETELKVGDSQRPFSNSWNNEHRIGSWNGFKSYRESKKIHQFIKLWYHRNLQQQLRNFI